MSATNLAPSHPVFADFNNAVDRGPGTRVAPITERARLCPCARHLSEVKVPNPLATSTDTVATYRIIDVGPPCLGSGRYGAHLGVFLTACGWSRGPDRQSYPPFQRARRSYCKMTTPASSASGTTR